MKKIIHIHTYIYIQAISILLMYIPHVMYAGVISFETSSQTLGISQDVVVNVFLHTEKESINAVRGSLSFATDTLEYSFIIDGDSSVNFWIEKPHIQENDIVFSGISAGGITGDHKLLFSIVLKAKKAGTGFVSMSDMQILKNDGKGTESLVTSSPLFLNISDTHIDVDTITTQTRALLQDNEPPEDFVPIVTTDSQMFDGKYFLVFATQDKGIGIDHYEIQEGQWGDSVQAVSPYVLQDQSRKSDIFIKAIDKNHNIRMVTIQSSSTSMQKTSYVFGEWVIVVIISILLYIAMLVFKKKL